VSCFVKGICSQILTCKILIYALFAYNHFITLTRDAQQDNITCFSIVRVKYPLSGKLETAGITRILLVRHLLILYLKSQSLIQGLLYSFISYSADSQLGLYKW
jgi:hypothetical protein